jgi:integrase/recombinase XerD
MPTKIDLPKKIYGNRNNPDSLYFYQLRFLESCKIRNFSKSTVLLKEVSTRLFIIWCDDRGLSTPAEITRPILQRYQRHLFLRRKENGEPLTVSCQSGYISSIKSFFAWLARENYILYNPASEIDLPQVSRRLPIDIMTVAEIESILNGIDVNSALGIRNRTIMEILYSTGIRRMELTNLKVTDIDMERGTIMIRHGKGDKDRMLPIGDRAISWIRKYLDEIRPELVIGLSDNYLILGTNGEGLKPNTLTHLMRKYLQLAGKKGSCHVFRHSMATLMLENGADIRYIQVMLGHVDLNTTQIYTQVSIRKLKEIHTATHPARGKSRQKLKTIHNRITVKHETMLVQTDGSDGSDQNQQQDEQQDKKHSEEPTTHNQVIQ